MGIQLKNNASGTLATAISASDTGIVLTTGNGANFPALGASDYFYATLESTGGTFEVIKVTARSGDSMTVVRAQEGSTANSFAAGSRIELRVTAQSVLDAVNQVTAAQVEFTPVGALTATNVQAAIAEVVTDLALSSGSSTVGYLPAGTGAVATTVQAKLRESISVTDYGASSSATAAVNLAAFKAAVAATPTGGTLYVPAAAAEYVIDTNGGESASIIINKRMTVLIDGTVKSNFGAIQANPPTIFLVSGADVAFTGNGIVEGDGATDQVNTGTAATSPSLIKVTGDSFTMTGLTIRKPHKYGLNLYGCKYAKVTNNNFTGGPTEYRDTAYFAINSYFGDKHIISDNQFYPTSDGGMFVQCIFVNSTDNMSIQGNIAQHPYEKLAYVVSSNNIISNNIVVGNENFIPGTNSKGTIGPPIRNDGINSKITNNFIRFCGGGISSIGGGSLDISDNTIYLTGQSGIAVFGGSVDFDYLSIRGNVVECGNLSGIAVTNGILVRPNTGGSKYLDISHNQLIGFAPPDTISNIAAWTANTVIPYYSVIKPTVPNSRIFATIGGGTTGGTEPTWNTTIGGTTSDGTVTWVAVGVDNTTSGGINLESPNAFLFEKSIISHNVIDGSDQQDCRTAMLLQYLQNSVVSNNIMTASTFNIRELNGAANRYLNNSCDISNGSSADISGISATSFGEGNKYNFTLPLIATVTLTVGVSTVTIPTTTLLAAPNAKVLVTAVNASAATYLATNGLFATVTAPNVILTSGNATNFAGTEQFNVQVIQ